MTFLETAMAHFQASPGEYLQHNAIKEITRNIWRDAQETPTQCAPLSLLIQADCGHKIITRLYAAFREDACKHSLHSRAKWESDCYLAFSDVQWRQTVLPIKEISSNVRFCLLHFNYGVAHTGLLHCCTT